MCCGVHSKNVWIPNGLCVCFSMQGEDPYSGLVLSTKKTVKIFKKLGDSSPMRQSRFRLGRDKDGIRSLGFPVYYGASVFW